VADRRRCERRFLDALVDGILGGRVAHDALTLS
jgi:hypothetical protein